MVKLFPNRIIKSNKGISIILAIIIIIILGLAGSVFAYLIASGSIVSRSNLLSAEAKYAAKSGVEITFYQIEKGGAFLETRPSGCPLSPVLAQKTTVTAVQYLSGNIQGNLPDGVNYTPTFCAAEGKLSSPDNCTYYAITSNGFAGGTKREITAEVGVEKNDKGCTGIYAESEQPNSAK